MIFLENQTTLVGRYVSPTHKSVRQYTPGTRVCCDRMLALTGNTVCDHNLQVILILTPADFPLQMSSTQNCRSLLLHIRACLTYSFQLDQQDQQGGIQKIGFLGPPQWSKSNAWRAKEERKLVLTMTSYAWDCHHRWCTLIIWTKIHGYVTIFFGNNSSIEIEIRLHTEKSKCSDHVELKSEIHSKNSNAKDFIEQKDRFHLDSLPFGLSSI